MYARLTTFLLHCGFEASDALLLGSYFQASLEITAPTAALPVAEAAVRATRRREHPCQRRGQLTGRRSWRAERTVWAPCPLVPLFRPSPGCAAQQAFSTQQTPWHASLTPLEPTQKRRTEAVSSPGCSSAFPAAGTAAVRDVNLRSSSSVRRWAFTIS